MFLLCLGTSLKEPLIPPGSAGLLGKSTRACSLCGQQQGGDVLLALRGLQLEQSSEHSGTESGWLQSVCTLPAALEGRGTRIT